MIYLIDIIIEIIKTDPKGKNKINIFNIFIKLTDNYPKPWMILSLKPE